MTVKFNEFGEFIRQRRIALGFSLRRFALAYSFCPAHISKMERGIIKPYINDKPIRRLAEALEIEPGTKIHEEMKKAWEASMRISVPDFFISA